MTRVSALRRSAAASTRFGLAAVALGIAAPAQADSDHVTLGASAAMAPRFQGSDKYRVQPLPVVDVQWGRFFARTGDGIGLTIVRTDTFTAGASVTWMQGYDDDDVPPGIRGVDDALGGRVFVSARYEGAVATLSATQALTETDRGLSANLNLAYPIRATGRLTVTPSLGTTWASGKYARSYFGVDPSESAASGLAAYEPSSGFTDVTLRIGVKYRVTDSFSVLGSLGLVRLLDVGADSPLVERKTQPTAMFGGSYTF